MKIFVKMDTVNPIATVGDLLRMNDHAEKLRREYYEFIEKKVASKKEEALEYAKLIELRNKVANALEEKGYPILRCGRFFYLDTYNFICISGEEILSPEEVEAIQITELKEILLIDLL